MPERISQGLNTRNRLTRRTAWAAGVTAGAALVATLTGCGSGETTGAESSPTSRTTLVEGKRAQADTATVWQNLNALALQVKSQQETAGLPTSVIIEPQSSSLTEPGCNVGGIRADGFEVAKYEACDNGTSRFTVVPSVEIVGGAAYEVNTHNLSFRKQTVAGEPGMSGTYEQKNSETGQSTLVSADTMSTPGEWLKLSQLAQTMGNVATKVICGDAPTPANVRGCENIATTS